LKNIVKKEESYNKLEELHYNLLKKFENLRSHFEESELIRKEQSKLIKTMQNEIDYLRQDDCNVEKAAYIPLNKKKKASKTTNKTKETNILKKNKY
jgi:hypothetical protein